MKTNSKNLDPWKKMVAHGPEDKQKMQSYIRHIYNDVVTMFTKYGCNPSKLRQNQYQKLKSSHD